MKFNDMEEIIPEFLQDAKAVEVRKLISDELEKTSQEIVDKVTATENDQKQMAASLATVHQTLVETRRELESLKQQVAAKTKQQSFDARMAEIQAVYVLNESQSTAVAAQIKDLDDGAYATWKAAFDLFATKRAGTAETVREREVVAAEEPHPPASSLSAPAPILSLTRPAPAKADGQKKKLEKPAAANAPDVVVTYPLPEASGKRRLTVWDKLGGGPLTIAILFHVILLIIAAIWIFQSLTLPEPKTDFTLGGGSGERGTGYQVKNDTRAQNKAVSKTKHVFAEGAPAEFMIPDPGDEFGKLSSNSDGLGGAGRGSGFGNGVGDGHGLGTMGRRCSKDDRLKRLAANGGTPVCEDAVVKGLRWLKANQQADGSWKGQDKIAMTGLALLAYFGHCETPASPEFGESCMRAITYLVNVGMQTDGRLVDGIAIAALSNTPINNRDTKDAARVALGVLDALGTRDARDASAAQAREVQARETQVRETREAQAKEAQAREARAAQLRNARRPFNVNPYAHAIATYALAEATIFCGEIKRDVPSLVEVTTKAGQFIIDSQHSSGGWDYNYATSGPRGGDVSIVGWQLQALKSCSHTRITYKGMDACITKAFDYLAGRQAYSGGFGYTDTNGVKDSLTGIGMLCNQMWDRGKSDGVRRAADYLLGIVRFDFKHASNLYAHYYISQAMMQSGGEDWKKYNALFRDPVLDNQKEDGSWATPSDSFARDPVFSTCLCTLILEVYYRFLSTDEAPDKQKSN